MLLHQNIQIKGCITQEHYIKGRSLAELERILGFQTGRLDKGIVVAALTQLPAAHQFELLGYSQVAEHKHSPDATKGLDVKKLKEIVLKEAFTLFGYKRLVKVMANQSHNDQLDNDAQYPPGQGVPQWKLISLVDAKVVAIVLPGKVFQ